MPVLSLWTENGSCLLLTSWKAMAAQHPLQPTIIARWWPLKLQHTFCCRLQNKNNMNNLGSTYPSPLMTSDYLQRLTYTSTAAVITASNPFFKTGWYPTSTVSKRKLKWFFSWLDSSITKFNHILIQCCRLLQSRPRLSMSMLSSPRRRLTFTFSTTSSSSMSSPSPVM